MYIYQNGVSGRSGPIQFCVKLAMRKEPEAVEA
jgi:hypothetical protein